MSDASLKKIKYILLLCVYILLLVKYNTDVNCLITTLTKSTIKVHKWNGTKFYLNNLYVLFTNVNITHLIYLPATILYWKLVPENRLTTLRTLYRLTHTIMLTYTPIKITRQKEPTYLSVAWETYFHGLYLWNWNIKYIYIFICIHTWIHTWIYIHPKRFANYLYLSARTTLMKHCRLG